jgi:hypothetical protein
MLGRNRLFQLDRGIEAPCQRGVFNDGNIVLFGQFADPQGDLLDALGHAMGAGVRPCSYSSATA